MDIFGGAFRILVASVNIPRLATASQAGGCSAAGMRTLFCNCVAEQGRVKLDGPPRKATHLGGFILFFLEKVNLLLQIFLCFFFKFIEKESYVKNLFF